MEKRIEELSQINQIQSGYCLVYLFEPGKVTENLTKSDQRISEFKKRLRPERPSANGHRAHQSPGTVQYPLFWKART